MLKAKTRNSTLELLRILCMLGVLGCHYMNKDIGGGLNTTVPTNILTSHLLESMCITSVNVFILIGGYFMLNQKTTGLRKAVELYLVLLCYYIPLYVGGIITGETSFSLKTLSATLFPFFFGDKWFLEAYIILLLFAPFLNILIERLNQYSHMLLLFIWLALFSVWPSFLPNPPLTDKGYGITNFTTLYLTSSYIKKYCSLPKNRKTVFGALVVFLASVLIITLSSFTFLRWRAWGYCFFFNLTASTALFYAFLNLPETCLPIVNTVAGLTFGVYISHSSIHLQNLVYHKMMKMNHFINSPIMPLHFAVCVVAQFVFFAVIEYFRQLAWKPTVSKWLKNSRILAAEQKWERTVFER